MNRASFDTYVETQLAPILKKGDVIILDNLSSHKSQYAANPLRGRGAWLLFLPPYSPSDPDRDRLLKAIGANPKGSGANLRRALECRRECLRPLHQRRLL